MPKKTKPTEAEIIRRLATIKLMVVGLADAMPQMAKELRREVRESIDDLIEELA